MTHKFSNDAFDRLREVLNIGAGNAITALSQMIGETVQITAPRASLLSIEDVPEFIGAPDEVSTAIVLKVLGDTEGVILFFLPEDQATTLTHLLTKRDAPDMNDFDRSALLEMGNVLTGSCFSALGNFLEMLFSQSTPDTATDMIGALLSAVLAELGEQTDSVLVTEVDMTVSSQDIFGKMYFMFDPIASQKILSSTEKKLQQ